MNSMNKERHEKWVRGVLRMNHKVREWKTFSSKKNKVLDSHRSEIDALLDHTFDDIEAYVPPLIIKKMCKKTWPVTQPDQKARNLAVNFATRQILDEIENPEVLRIRISGRNGIRVTSAVKDLPQIQQRFNIVIQVDASLYPNIRGIEENIATQLGFSLNIQMLNKFLKTTSFLIFLDDIYESIDLYKVGSEWWNSKNIQKIVCRTRSQTVCRRMAVDREIRLDDHLLSWELFCRNVGNIVHSSGFQHRATDVVQKCSGHLLAVVLMARALNMVFNVSTWEHASYLLSLPHRSQMEDRVLYNALAFIMGQCSGSAHECVKYCAFYMEREGANKLDLIQEWIRHELISTFDEGQKMVRGLVSAFLLESSQNGYSLATALFLDRHLTATSLSEFGIKNMGNLKFCVLGECDEIQTIIDAYDGRDVVLGSLEYLNLHYMKNLRSIWKGPLILGSLSHLKALVWYTCPQLTTIFTLNLFPKLYELEELVVDDCPKIESIVVTPDPTATEPMLWRARYLFPKLRKISLHYMPKLVSISNGLRISPILEWMSFYDCPSLKTLSPEEVHSNDLKVIIGEAKWWRELNWNKSKWPQLPNLDAIFHPIEQDTYFITRLAEIDDQLQARMQETELSQQSGPGDSLKAPAVKGGTSSKQKQVA
ncbi:unnamed protein product, partial [Vitis vinifera]